MSKNDRVDVPAGGKAQSSAVTNRRRVDSLIDGKPQIGLALRSVYDRTVDEAIPSDLLDLLGRLD